MGSTATQLERRITDNGYSQRSFAEALSEKLHLRKPLHHRTVHRYVTGDSPWPKNYAEKAAQLLFSRASERKAFLHSVESAVKENAGNSRYKNLIKKAYTDAKAKCDCIVSWQTILKDGKFIEVEVKAVVHMKNAKKPLMTISSIEGMLLHFQPSAESKNTLEAYYNLCSENGLNKLGLFEVVRRSIHASPLMQLIDSSSVVVDKQRFSSWLSRSRYVLRVLEGKIELPDPSQKDSLCAKEMRAVIGDMTAFRDHPENMQKALKKLIKIVNSFFKRLSP